MRIMLFIANNVTLIIICFKNMPLCILALPTIKFKLKYIYRVVVNKIKIQTLNK